MILNKKLMIPSTFLLLTCHIGIFYFWIFDWKKISTPYGLVIWIISTVCGFLLYYHFKHQNSNKIVLIGSSLLLIVSSSFMIFLGIITGIKLLVLCLKYIVFYCVKKSEQNRIT
ncbi:hypothetical protein IEE_02338 [Bacillus cereus BAG5X1-1]|uniref:Uncharacterized protein n=1 Tax=Bacillus cereus BAG5X1-1 TaxID=1053189 RepID=J8AQX2_BACCE|nr:hypothetical protein [Bacillus cereus]EJQ45457.1 hypothetical protein IEE_02338 [Bacillus cereus BAG5X1-1]